MTLEQAKRNIQSVPLAATDDDIILEILLRLPVESLLRCKSVCKLWLSLISDPFFIKSHLNLSSSSTTNALRRLIFTDGHGIDIKSCPLNDVVFEKSGINSLGHVPPSHSHPMCYHYMRKKIVGSCNGLVCIVGFHFIVDILFIWNPCTKISTSLYSTFDMPPAGRCNAAYGFAYDKATDDYKIVAVSRRDRYQAINEKKVKIYSLKTGNWKHIGDFPHVYPVDISGVFLNGYLHWMATPTPRNDNAPTYPCRIVYLDIAHETYGEVSQPVYDEGRKVLTLGVLGEWLCVLCNYHLTFADVWVMKVYGVQDSWTKLASVSYSYDMLSPYYDLPLFISNDGTILLQAAWDLFLYDSSDASCSMIEKFYRCYDATTYVESLVSPYIPPSALDDNKLMMI